MLLLLAGVGVLSSKLGWNLFGQYDKLVTGVAVAGIVIWVTLFSDLMIEFGIRSRRLKDRERAISRAKRKRVDRRTFRLVWGLGSLSPFVVPFWSILKGEGASMDEWRGAAILTAVFAAGYIPMLRWYERILSGDDYDPK